MKWDKYTLITRTDAVDILSACLPEAGIEGIEVEDNIPLSEEDTKGMFIDILPDLPKDDGSAKISFYLEQDKSQEILANVKELLADLISNQMIISKNPQFTGISARQQLEFTTHLLLTD